MFGKNCTINHLLTRLWWNLSRQSSLCLKRNINDSFEIGSVTYGTVFPELLNQLPQYNIMVAPESLEIVAHWIACVYSLTHRCTCSAQQITSLLSQYTPNTSLSCLPHYLIKVAAWPRDISLLLTSALVKLRCYESTHTTLRGDVGYEYISFVLRLPLFLYIFAKFFSTSGSSSSFVPSRRCFAV